MGSHSRKHHPADLRHKKRWYGKNKERIAKKKRERYANDPVFRAQRKQYALERSARMRAEGKAKVYKRPPKPRPPTGVGLTNEFEIIAEGRSLRVIMHSAGYMAPKMGVRVSTLQMWTRDGILPEALYRDAVGRRLYTEFQVSAVIDAYLTLQKGRARNLPLKHSPFHRRLQMIWSDMPQGIPTGQA